MSPAVSQKYKDVKELEAEVAVMNAEIELKKSGKDSKAVKSTGKSDRLDLWYLAAAMIFIFRASYQAMRLFQSRNIFPPFSGGSKKITKSDLTSAKKKLESARKALPPWSEVDPEAKVDDLTDPTLEQGKLKILPTAELMEHYEKRSANLDQPCCVAFESES